jgi:hypothetical protein
MILGEMRKQLERLRRIFSGNCRSWGHLVQIDMQKEKMSELLRTKFVLS